MTLGRVRMLGRLLPLGSSLGDLLASPSNSSLRGVERVVSLAMHVDEVPTEAAGLAEERIHFFNRLIL
jgi:hypothetical protein